MPLVASMLGPGPLEWTICFGILLYCAARGFLDANRSVYMPSHVYGPIKAIVGLILLAFVVAVPNMISRREFGDLVFISGVFVVLTVVSIWPSCLIGYFVAHRIGSRFSIRAREQAETTNDARSEE